MIYDFILKNYFIFILFFFLIFVFLFLEFLDFSEKKNLITVNDYIKLVNNNKAIIIDLRNKNDYDKIHILNSINYPFEFFDCDNSLFDKYKNMIIVLIHHDINIVKKTLKSLKNIKKLNVKYFNNGINEWIMHGMPTKSKK